MVTPSSVKHCKGRLNLCNCQIFWCLFEKKCGDSAHEPQKLLDSLAPWTESFSVENTLLKSVGGQGVKEFWRLVRRVCAWSAAP